VKEGTFGRGALRGNPSARTQLFTADRCTNHGSKKEETVRRFRDFLRFVTSAQKFS